MRKKIDSHDEVPRAMMKRIFAVAELIVLSGGYGPKNEVSEKCVKKHKSDDLLYRIEQYGS